METVTLTLQAMAHGGAALGRAGGRVIFVPYALPGERVRVTLTEVHQRYAHAQLLDVLEASPARVTPPCPHFGAKGCAGCQWQHIAPNVQPQLKGLIVRDQLQRVGQIAEPPLLEPLTPAPPWETRVAVRFAVTPEGRLGYPRADGTGVLAIEDCPVLHPQLREVLAAFDFALPELAWMELRTAPDGSDTLLVLQTVDNEPPALSVELPLSVIQIGHDGAVAPLIGMDYLSVPLDEVVYRVSPTTPYPPYATHWPVLRDVILEALALTADETALELYCGAGFFTRALATSARQVLAVDPNPAAAADARFNTRDYANVTVEAEEPLTVLERAGTAWDAVLLHPPAQGLDGPTLDALAALQAPRIAYLADDPATLARDVQRLARSGYSLVWVQPLDLLPQSFVVTNVALLALVEE